MSNSFCKDTTSACNTCHDSQFSHYYYILQFALNELNETGRINLTLQPNPIVHIVPLRCMIYRLVSWHLIYIVFFLTYRYTIGNFESNQSFKHLNFHHPFDPLTFVLCLFPLSLVKKLPLGNRNSAIAESLIVNE